MPWTAEHDRLCLSRYLATADSQFDPAWNLLCSRNTATYHTRLGGQIVHPYRESLEYALAQLDAGALGQFERAGAVLDRVLDGQDTAPDSRTYGIWSYFADEPLDQMHTPDWNWADFHGERLVPLLSRHGSRLPTDLRARAEAALRHAAASIQRRNVTAGYTNICALGTYVTLATAELFGDQELLAYAVERLRAFHADTFSRGSFAEFNSPTYTIVTITALTHLAETTRHAEALGLTTELLDRAWHHVMDHWHPATKQWAGPHSRCYHTSLRHNAHAQLVLQKASGGRLGLYDDASLPGSSDVPLTDYARYAHWDDSAVEVFEPRTRVEIYEPGPRGRRGTTWMHPEVTLGTFDRLDLWNQRRAVIAYWGSPTDGAHLQVQCLHDGRDFASALVYCVQHDGFCLVLINFASDGGDWHPSLDRVQDGRFTARDLRVRVRLGNFEQVVSQFGPLSAGETWTVDLGDGLPLSIRPLGGVFGGGEVAWETSLLPDGLALDGVMHQSDGPETIVWDEVGAAWAALAIRFAAPIPAVMVDGDTHTVRLSSSDAGYRLRVGASARVTSGREQQEAYLALTAEV